MKRRSMFEVLCQYLDIHLNGFNIYCGDLTKVSFNPELDSTHWHPRHRKGMCKT